MNRCAKRGFGRTALAESLQDSLNVAHPIGLVDVFNGCQRLVIGQEGLNRGKAHEAPFKGVVRDSLLGLEELSQTAAIRRETFRFDRLGNTFVQPCRTPSARSLIHERMSQLMF